MTILTIPSRTAAQATLAGLAVRAQRQGAAGGITGGGWRDPHDEPCKPGRHPLWPGGPALPRWIELEAATATPDARYAVVARGSLKR